MYDIKNLNIWKKTAIDDIIKPICIEINASLLEARMKEEKDFVNVKEILEGTGLAEVRQKKSARGLKFPMYVTPEMEKEDIDVLALSQRSRNALKRGGYTTIGQLLQKVRCSSDLSNLRNCGAKSIAEIMDCLFKYQYDSLKPERRAEYIAKVIKMNLPECKEMVG